MGTLFCSEMVAAALKAVNVMDAMRTSSNMLPKDFTKPNIPGMTVPFGPLKEYDLPDVRPRARSVDPETVPPVSPRRNLTSPRRKAVGTTGDDSTSSSGGSSARPSPRFGHRRNLSNVEAEPKKIRAPWSPRATAGRRRSSANMAESETLAVPSFPSPLLPPAPKPK